MTRQNPLTPFVASTAIFLLSMFFSLNWKTICPEKRNQRATSITIRGKVRSELLNTKLSLDNYLYFRNMEFDSAFNLKTEARSLAKNGNTYLLPDTDLKGARYATLRINSETLTTINEIRFIVEPGDSVIINVSGPRPGISGRGAGKYECQYRIDSTINAIAFWKASIADHPAEFYFQEWDRQALNCLNILDSFKSTLNPSIYWELKMKTVFDFQIHKNMFCTLQGFHPNVNNSRYNNPLWSREKYLESLKNINFLNSYTSCQFLLDQYIFDSCYMLKRAFDMERCYNQFRTVLTGIPREWMICQIIDKNKFGYTGTKIAWCIDNAIESGYITSLSTRIFLSRLKDDFSPGLQAFDFSLEDLKGHTVHLSDFKGKVVLLDFYSHSCSPCRAIHPILDSINEIYKGRSFTLISVFVPGASQNDSVWKDLVNREIYSSKTNLNLIDDYLIGGKGNAVTSFRISGFPALVLIDRNGIKLRQPRFPGFDKGKDLVDLINQNL